MRKKLLLMGIGVLILALAAGCQPGGAPAAAALYKDGVYTAVSEADPRGYAQVKLFIARDEILHVEVVEHEGNGLAKNYALYGGDRFTILKEAHETLAQRIMDAGTWDVEAVTGATTTSSKVKDAAKRALDKAAVNRTGTGTYYDGTFMGMSNRTARGWGIAWVTIKDDKVTAISLAGTTPRRDEANQLVVDGWANATWNTKDETYPYAPYHEAKAAIAQALVDRQGAKVDIFTGATSSSNQWM